MKYKNSKKLDTIVKKDYSKTIIFDRSDFDNNGHLLQTVTIPPKTKQRVHSHDSQTEVFYILEGECMIFINSDKFIAKPGDAFICSPGDDHNLWNKSDKPFKLIVFKFDLPQDGDDTNWPEEK